MSCETQSFINISCLGGLKLSEEQAKTCQGEVAESFLSPVKQHKKTEQQE